MRNGSLNDGLVLFHSAAFAIVAGKLGNPPASNGEDVSPVPSNTKYPRGLAPKIGVLLPSGRTFSAETRV